MTKEITEEQMMVCPKKGCNDYGFCPRSNKHLETNECVDKFHTSYSLDGEPCPPCIPYKEPVKELITECCGKPESECGCDNLNPFDMQWKDNKPVPNVYISKEEAQVLWDALSNESMRRYGFIKPHIPLVEKLEAIVEEK